jgi:diketogulonate reductase-like aldo/keto reductase
MVQIPRSTNPQRIAQNIDVFDFDLSDDDMAAMTLDRGKPRRPIPTSSATDAHQIADCDGTGFARATEVNPQPPL